MTISRKPKIKFVAAPENIVKVFNELKQKFSGQMLWDSAVYCDKTMSDYIDKIMLAEKPPKAINGEVMGWWTTQNEKLVIKLFWHEKEKEEQK